MKTRFYPALKAALFRPMRAKRGIVRSCWCSERGAAAVEFAFIVPILLLLFSGIVQFGSVMFLENHMTNVARETSRRIAVGELAQADAASSAQQSLVNWGVNYDVSVATVDVGGGKRTYSTRRGSGRRISHVRSSGIANCRTV